VGRAAVLDRRLHRPRSHRRGVLLPRWRQLVAGADRLRRAHDLVASREHPSRPDPRLSTATGHAPVPLIVGNDAHPVRLRWASRAPVPTLPSRPRMLTPVGRSRPGPAPWPRRGPARFRTGAEAARWSRVARRRSNRRVDPHQAGATPWPQRGASSTRTRPPPPAAQRTSPAYRRGHGWPISWRRCRESRSWRAVSSTCRVSNHKSLPRAESPNALTSITRPSLSTSAGVCRPRVSVASRPLANSCARTKLIAASSTARFDISSLGTKSLWCLPRRRLSKWATGWVEATSTWMDGTSRMRSSRLSYHAQGRLPGCLLTIC